MSQRTEELDRQLSRHASEDDKRTASLDGEQKVALTKQDEWEAANVGVTRIEALYLVFGKGWKLWMLYGSIGLICYIASLASNTTYVYLPFATSAFSSHSLLGAIQTANSIIGTVSKPFIAKLADLTSRPIAYATSLVFYVIGLVVLAASTGVHAVAAGQLIMTLGATGLEITTTIVIGDIIDLQWRGFAQGLAASPYIINAFISAYITSGLGLEAWRWGYGMFAIMLPAAFAPALFVLFWADIKAKRIGALSLASSSHARREAAKKASNRTWVQTAMHYFAIIDGFGLILFGLAWTLILIPMTIFYRVSGGWSNPSLIAMETFGGVLFIAFLVWELKYCQYPLMPLRILNRTFLCCVAIDFLYFFTGYFGGLYLSSFVYVVKDWSTRDYTFFLNTLGVGLCFFGIIAGVIQRVTHRYKYLQIFGVCVRAIGMLLQFFGTGARATDSMLIMSQVLISLGGACSVIGTQVASQASVPHQDLATVVALLSLWTGIGGSIGNAAGAAVWGAKMPGNLNARLSGLLSPEEIRIIFGSITYARFATDEVRGGVLQAYEDTVKWPMYFPSFIFALVPIIFACFTTDFYLGDTQNAVEDKKIVILNESEIDLEDVARRAREAEAKALSEKPVYA